MASVGVLGFPKAEIERQPQRSFQTDFIKLMPEQQRGRAEERKGSDWAGLARLAAVISWGHGGFMGKGRLFGKKGACGILHFGGVCGFLCQLCYGTCAVRARRQLLMVATLGRLCRGQLSMWVKCTQALRREVSTAPPAVLGREWRGGGCTASAPVFTCLRGHPVLSIPGPGPFAVPGPPSCLVPALWFLPGPGLSLRFDLLV